MIWHEPTWRQFSSTQQAGKGAQAWLVLAKAGCGGEAFVWRMVLALLCQHSTTSGACGTCQSCCLLRENSHPDCYALTESPIKIEAVREIIGKIHQSPQLGGSKVVLIQPATAMTDAAAACLLKILEEPPENTVFILAAESARQLLPTLSSRCRRLNIGIPSETQALAWLGAQEDMAEADLKPLLSVYAGAPLQVKDSPGWDYFLMLANDLEQCARDPQAILQVSEKYEKSELEGFFIGVFYWLQTWLKSEAAPARPEQLTAQWDYCLQKRKNWLKVATINKRLLIESMLIHWHNICKETG